MYIGTQPAIGQNRKLDSIAASFNGVLTTFNLTVNTSSIIPSNVYQLFISLGGVLQNPGVDFTANGNQITFTTAPTAGLSFFGIFQGDSITGTLAVADASITTLKLATGLTVTHAVGTAAAPSITFVSDLANGAFAPAANTFGIATAGTERMRIRSDGSLCLGFTGTTLATYDFNNASKSQGTLSFSVWSSTENASAIQAFVVSADGFNTAACAIRVGRNNTTTRSINAGGTVNASGADYAEYIEKAGNFTIAKGDVCGVTADGLLTDTFADAISFVVKSTNPSYVGGDTWGTEDVIGPKPEADDTEALAQWEAALEAARQKVDRVAFAGQAPVNVTGATPGQYIVPVATADGGITGIAKDESDLALPEYMRAVGKVIAIEDDGRARIIVKVA